MLNQMGLAFPQKAKSGLQDVSDHFELDIEVEVEVEGNIKFYFEGCLVSEHPLDKRGLAEAYAQLANWLLEERAELLRGE